MSAPTLGPYFGRLVAGGDLSAPHSLPTQAPRMLCCGHKWWIKPRRPRGSCCPRSWSHLICCWFVEPPGWTPQRFHVLLGLWGSRACPLHGGTCELSGSDSRTHKAAPPECRRGWGRAHGSVCVVCRHACQCVFVCLCCFPASLCMGVFRHSLSIG